MKARRRRVTANTTLLSHVSGSASAFPPTPTVFTATVQYDSGYRVAGVLLYPPGSSTGQPMNLLSDTGSSQKWVSQQAPIPQPGTWTAKAAIQPPSLVASGTDTV